MDIFIIPSLIATPFALLFLPYLVLFILKREIKKEYKVATMITFGGLLAGLFFTYDSYKVASSMGNIYFIFWFFWALVGGASVYILSWLVVRNSNKSK